MNQPSAGHKYIWLDLIRGLAALEVLMQHLRTLVFQNYWDGPTSFFKKIFYFITGFSHESVIVFFVLSGFLITGSIVNARKKGTFSSLNYGLDRLVRLWIVLIPGLVLTLIVDRAGIHWFGTNPAYLGNIHYTGNIDVAANLNGPTFFGNIFFLQGILVDTFGSNTPLWSLTNEFWYYILFPMIYFLFYLKKIGIRVLLSILTIAIFFFIGQDILQYFLVWLIGSALFFVKENFPAPSVRLKQILLIGGIIAFGLYFYELRISGRLDWVKDIMSGLITVVLCYVGLYSGMRSKFLSRIVSFFSGMSYSLYVIHLPLALFLSSWLVGSQKNWGPSYFFLYLFMIAIVLGVTVVFWYCFESRYIQARTYIKRRFFKSGTAFITN